MTVVGTGVGIGLAFGIIVTAPEPGAELLGGLLGSIGALYVAHLADIRH